MSNDKWTDKSIEDLLNDFPSIKDNRSKEKIYSQLVDQKKGQKRPKKWLPLLVAALAFIAFGMLVSSIIGQNGLDAAQNKDSSNEESVATSTDNSEQADSSSEAERSGTEESNQFSVAQADEVLRTSVYEETIGNQTLMTIGLTENANVVPVSFLVPENQITAAFGDLIPSSLELYQQYADDIDETQLGFDEYHPYLGNLEKTVKGIRHILPQDHQYDLASASIGVYFNTLSATFPDVAEITVVNEDGSAAEFSQVGSVEAISPKQRDVAYYSFTTTNGEIYLAPGYDRLFASATEAIEALAQSPNDFYRATIPRNVDFQLSETGDLVQIDFEGSVDLETMDRLEAVRMIESLALTAASFDKKIAVKGLQSDSWNGFDFTQPLPVPLAPNLLEWPIQ